MRFIIRALLFIVGPAGPWIFVGSLAFAIGVWLYPDFDSRASLNQDIPNENLHIELRGLKKNPGDAEMVITFQNSSSVPFLWPREGPTLLKLEGKASDCDWHILPYAPASIPSFPVPEKQIADAFIAVPPGANVRITISTREGIRYYGVIEPTYRFPDGTSAHRVRYATSLTKLDEEALMRFSHVRVVYDPLSNDAQVLRRVIEAGAVDTARLPYGRIVSNALDWKAIP